MAESLPPQQQLVSGHGDHSKEVDDIVVEILSRLPVKSLLRFRSVCKSWRGLISDSYFVKKHLSHTVTDTTSNSFRLCQLLGCPRIVDLQGLEVHHDHIHQPDSDLSADILDRPIILGSCNGLICIQVFLGIYCDDIYVWNPSTRVNIKVPKQNLSNRMTWYHGFGYDATTEDYKLVLGDSSRAPEKNKYVIFSLKTGSWRIVEDFQFVNLVGEGWFVNGALNWLDSERDGSAARIVSFDLAKEK